MFDVFTITIIFMDVDYRIDNDSSSRKADVVVLRKCDFVRHVGETKE